MRLKRLNRHIDVLTIIRLGMVLLCFLIPCQAQQEREKQTGVQPPAENVVPVETPAGKQFNAWLTVINSGKREAIRQFIADNFEPPPNTEIPVERITDRYFELYNNSGGFKVGKVFNSTPDRISVFVEAKLSGYWMLVGINTSSQPSHKIMGMGFRNTEAPPELLPRKKLSEKQIQKNINDLITKLVQTDKFSGVILVAKNGQPIYRRAAGLASRPWNIANRMDTKFNVASIGKMFTAVAVAQLVEQGKLSYDDTLGKWLPDYPDREIAQKITVSHLLSHTSGIKEAASVDGSATRERRTIKDHLPTKPGDTLKFEPGTKLEYSNYGFLLLGAIIERASGQDYFAYIREHIYKPAGMSETDSYELDTEPANLATGYMDAPHETRLSNIFKLGVKGTPFGGSYATAGDLVKFSLALQNHKLLSAQSLDTVWTGRLDYTETNSKYGYGFIVKRYNGTRIIGHGGGWFGITNKFDMYPDLGYTVVILNNIDSDPNSIAFKLREWLTQKDEKEDEKKNK